MGIHDVQHLIVRSRSHVADGARIEVEAQHIYSASIATRSYDATPVEDVRVAEALLVILPPHSRANALQRGTSGGRIVGDDLEGDAMSTKLAA